ncbi:MAG: ExbD/TolR family protein [Rhodomicrobium sp.]
MAEPMFNDGAGGASKPKLMAEINITPMVDVMLVLLVIFMVTAPLLVAGVRVDLPRNAAPKLSQLQKPLVVTLAADGQLYIGDESLGRDGLEARLTALRSKEGDATVYVRADRKTGYGQVLELLGQIGQAGYQRISLLSQPMDAAARPPAAIVQPAGMAGVSQ